MRSLFRLLYLKTLYKLANVRGLPWSQREPLAQACIGAWDDWIAAGTPGYAVLWLWLWTLHVLTRPLAWVCRSAE